MVSFIPSLRPKVPEDAASHITVSDPVQHSEGMNKFTSFRVDVRGEIGIVPDVTPTSTSSSCTSSSATPGGVANTSTTQHASSSMFQLPHHSAVLRRYSDFVWLQERLSKERAGAILPPLPEKQAVSRFSPEFIEERRFQLELFLRRIAVHPELYDSPSFTTFLRADDVTFHAAKTTNSGATSNNTSTSAAAAATATIDDYYYGSTTTTTMGEERMSGRSPYGATIMPSTTTSRKKEGIKQWIAETKTSLQIATSTVDLISSPDDSLFEEMDRYIHSLETQMKHVLNQVTALVRKGKEIANGMFEFGLAFGLLR
jgi:sorting nexin-1/2